MSCCSKIFILSANIIGIVALVLGIYSTIKINENNETSIECDICKTLTNNWEECKSLCGEE